MDIRLYGRFSGHGSHAQVTRGFRFALAQAGHTVHEFDVRRADEDDYHVGGALAPHAVFTGDLRYVPLLARNARHRERWIMVAPNSDKLPPKLAAAISDLATTVLAPSSWAKMVLSNNYFPDGKVELVRHGLMENAEPWQQAGALIERHQEWQGGAFKVVHFSSSETDRKGTLALLRAWTKFYENPSMELHLVLDPVAQISLMRRLIDANMTLPPGVTVHGRVDLGIPEMTQFLHKFHLVAQPSRGEGFGLVPLEARAAGVPVLMTYCTGHLDQLLDETWTEERGIDLVQTSLNLHDLDEAPGGRAPQVDPEKIRESLARARDRWLRLSAGAQAHAEAVRTEWSWTRQLGPWIERLQP